MMTQSPPSVSVSHMTCIPLLRVAGWRGREVAVEAHVVGVEVEVVKVVVVVGIAGVVGIVGIVGVVSKKKYNVVGVVKSGAIVGFVVEVTDGVEVVVGVVWVTQPSAESVLPGIGPTSCVVCSGLYLAKPGTTAVNVLPVLEDVISCLINTAKSSSVHLATQTHTLGLGSDAIAVELVEWCWTPEVLAGHDVRSIVHSSWSFTLNVRLVEKNCVSDCERVTFPETSQVPSWEWQE